MNSRACAAVALAALFALSWLAGLGASGEIAGQADAASAPAQGSPSGIVLDIAYPRMMRPAFATSSGTLDVVLATSGTLASEPNVTLMPGGYACTVESVSYDGSNATLSARLPALPEGNYRLVVEESGVELSQTRAVSVKERFWPYHFVHLSDLHIGAEGTAERFPELREKISLVNPDFVVISGDIIDANVGGDSTAETLLMLELFSDFPCPTFAVPGNHEYGYIFSTGNGIQDYRDYVNPVLDYSFQYGQDTFAMLCTGKYATVADYMGMEVPHPNNNVTGLTDAQIDWLAEAFYEAPSYGNRFIVTHAPLVNVDDNQEQTPDDNRLEAVEVAEHVGVDAILSGHVHEDKLFDADGVRQFGTWKEPAKPWHVQTRSALTADASGERGFDPDEPGFRDVRVFFDDIQLTEDRDDDGLLDADSSILLSELSVEGDGTDRVTVSNGLGRKLADGRVVVNTTEALAAPEAFGGLIAELTVGSGWTRAEVEVCLAPGETIEVTLVDNPAAPTIASAERVGDAVVVRFDKAVAFDMDEDEWWYWLWADESDIFTFLPDGGTTPVYSMMAQLNWSTWSFRTGWLGGQMEFRYSGSGVTDYQGRPLDAPAVVLDLEMPPVDGHFGPHPYLLAWPVIDALNMLTDYLELSFSEPMDRASVEESFVIEPYIPHTFRWVNESCALVTFDKTFRSVYWDVSTVSSGGYYYELIGSRSAGGAELGGIVGGSFHMNSDIYPPILLSSETLGNGSVKFTFSEWVSGLSEALSPACTVFRLSPSEYIAGPMISVPSVTLDPALVVDRRGNALDTDLDGRPGGPVVETAVRLPETTGSIEGSCPGDDVTLVSGRMFRRVDAVDGRYGASGLTPGVWVVTSGDASRSVTVAAGETTFANLVEEEALPVYGSITVRCPDGVVSVGGVERHVEGGTGTTFSGLEPGVYLVVYDDGTGARSESVAVASGGSAECSFPERADASAFPLEYAVAGLIVLALVALAVSFLVFKGGDAHE